jgi:hypothetical protein
MLDPKEVTKSRQAARDRIGTDAKRQIYALEEIADTLECIRAELVGVTHLMDMAARARS